MERSFARDLRALGEIFDFTDRFSEQYGLDQSLKHSVNLIVEELFTNMVKHNVGGGPSIRIALQAERGRLKIVLVDEDVGPWDPSQVQEVSPDRPVEERRPGGLGLRLVRALADEIEYDCQDRRMTVTVVKNLERSDVRGTADR